MKKYAEVKIDNFPIIEVEFTGEKSTEENFELYLKEVEKCYDKKKNLGIIFNAKKATIPGFKYQKMQAKWLKDNKQMMKEYCLGTAYMIPNTLIRKVLKTIFSLQTQPIPYFVCSNLEEAENWIHEQLIKNTK